MSVQQRHNGLQNEFVRLFHTFNRDGRLINLGTLPTIEIVAIDGVTLLDTVTAVKDNVGTYYADYFAPIDLPLGTYYDRWTFSFDGTTSEQFLGNFTINPRDAIINFLGDNFSQDISARMAELINALENEFIFEAQHIPIHWEQAQRSPDNKRFSFAFQNWNKDPRPLVRLNGRLIEGGWYADYAGNIIFEEPLNESDYVTADYRFAYFSQREMAGFVQDGLRALNSIPPARNSFQVVEQAPFYWNYGILLAAAVQAHRRLVFGLNFQERGIIFGEPGTDNAKSAQSTFQQLYNDYNSLWLEIAEGIKKELPSTRFIIVPEFTLPGGRARWFRFAFSSPV